MGAKRLNEKRPRHLRTEQRGVGFFCAYQSRRGRRRVEQKVNETALIFDGKADDLVFFDGAVRGLLGGGNHKVADTAALHFGGVFHKGKRIGGDTRLDSGRSGGFMGHHRGLSF